MASSAHACNRASRGDLHRRKVGSRVRIPIAAGSTPGLREALSVGRTCVQPSNHASKGDVSGQLRTLHVSSCRDMPFLCSEARLPHARAHSARLHVLRIACSCSCCALGSIGIRFFRRFFASTSFHARFVVRVKSKHGRNPAHAPSGRARRCAMRSLLVQVRRDWRCPAEPPPALDGSRYRSKIAIGARRSRWIRAADHPPPPPIRSRPSSSEVRDLG